MSENLILQELRLAASVLFDKTKTKNYSLCCLKSKKTMLKIIYTRQARKTLRMMQPKTAKRILTAIEKLAGNPFRIDLDVKALQHREGYRLRVGDWRVIYSQDGLVLAIEKIAPRGKAYRLRKSAP